MNYILKLSLFLIAVLVIFSPAFLVSAQYNYNNYNSQCTFHAYKLCAGNNIYWYDSCGNQQDLFQTCYGTNMICKYGQCVYQQPYAQHQTVKCYNNNLYWYDSLGRASGLYKSCNDSNSCTQDTCLSGKCQNILKCDGSTCGQNSADFNAYCAPNPPAGGQQNQQGQQNAGNLSVSFFAKKDKNSLQWQKTVEAGADSAVYFMVSAANNSSAQAGAVMVSANIPNEIVSIGNVQIDGVAVSGDIISGINMGDLAPNAVKTLTFEGKTGSILTQASKQAVISAVASGNTTSDSVSVNFSVGKQAASVSSSDASNFWDFIKRWYLWILVALVLIFLFVVVFRRLSSNA